MFRNFFPKKIQKLFFRIGIVSSQLSKILTYWKIHSPKYLTNSSYLSNSLISDNNSSSFIEDNQLDRPINSFNSSSFNSAFQVQTNYQVWMILQQHFSSGICFAELKSIAKFLQFYLNLPIISRNALRSFPLLIDWFRNNWNKVYPVLPYISLLDENHQPINQYRLMTLKMNC